MGEELQRARVQRALAEEMAARDDPHAVTVADVAARAGVSRRAFYELYADRESCFLETFESGLRLAGAEMYAAYARQARWQDGVRAALAELLGLLDREPAMARLCVVYALGGGKRVLQRRMEAIELLREFVDRGRLEGYGRTEPPEVAAEGVVGAVLAVIHTRLVAAEEDRSRRPTEEDRSRPSTEEDRSRRSTDEDRSRPLTELLGPLMNLVLLPYMGAARAGRELTRSAPGPAAGQAGQVYPRGGPFGEVLGQRDVGMRVTYRTARVLRTISERPGASNREVAEQAGIVDQGQISRLLSRLESLGLVANQGVGAGGSATRGTANAWVLTPRGEQIQRGVAPQARPSSRPLRR
jgi:AcrR family transcriptional regulator